MLFEFYTDGGKNTGPMTRLFGEHANQELGRFSARIPIDAQGSFAMNG